MDTSLRCSGAFNPEKKHMNIKSVLYRAAAVVTAGAVFLVTLPLTLWVVSVVFLMACVSSIVLAYKLRRLQKEGVVFTHVADAAPGQNQRYGSTSVSQSETPLGSLGSSVSARRASGATITGSYRVVSD